MAILWLYIPQLHPILGNLPVPGEHWFLPFAFGSLILLFDEARKFIVRKYTNSIVGEMALWTAVTKPKGLDSRTDAPFCYRRLNSTNLEHRK
jgi:hypothetical protein